MIKVDRARRTDTQPRDVVALEIGLIDQFLGDLLDAPEYRVSAFGRLGFRAITDQNFPLLDVIDRRLDVGAAQVDTEVEGGVLCHGWVSGDYFFTTKARRAQRKALGLVSRGIVALCYA